MPTKFGNEELGGKFGKGLSRLEVAFAAPLALLLTAGPAWAGGDTTSSLPVPRFVSIKADRVNVRGGPDKDHDVSYIYTRVGWPVEITAEFEDWRRIRDSDGTEGWVYHSLLSGRRTAVITMKNKDDLASLHERPDAASDINARLQAGVVAQVKHCAAGWCRVAGNGFDGWIEQQRLWGVYADEKVD